MGFHFVNQRCVRTMKRVLNFSWGSCNLPKIEKRFLRRIRFFIIKWNSHQSLRFIISGRKVNLQKFLSNTHNEKVKLFLTTSWNENMSGIKELRLRLVNFIWRLIGSKLWNTRIIFACRFCLRRNHLQRKYYFAGLRKKIVETFRGTFILWNRKGFQSSSNGIKFGRWNKMKVVFQNLMSREAEKEWKTTESLRDPKWRVLMNDEWSIQVAV